MKKENKKVAYLSMEIALENDIKTFAGGLGILAGDILRSASEKSFPMMGITLLNKHGYFKQIITPKGKQEVRPDKSKFSKLELLPYKINLKIGNDKVLVKAWLYKLVSGEGIEIPVYLLDTDWPENREKHRRLCENLYDGDLRKKLKQTIILGRGGVKLLEKIGLDNISKIHLNEGHGALAAIELFLSSKKKTEKEIIKEVRNRLVFTTHTPVKEAHISFFAEFLLKYQPDFPVGLEGMIENDQVNFTKIALYFSSYINGVSRKHAKVSKKMFSEYRIKAITNGVNSSLWTSPEFKKLFDLFVPGWEQNNSLLKRAKKIPLTEIKKAHLEAKRELIKLVEEKNVIKLSEDVFTIVFARRFAAYKRPTLLLSDLKKLKEINKKVGKIQIVYAGKAHPNDVVGRTLISDTIKRMHTIRKEIKIVFLENYDMEMAKVLVAGADLWLNNPVPPNEASATSGMKAAHNGVPQLSTWDGWWPEGYFRGKTGWTIEENNFKNNLYEVLSEKIIPLYYKKEMEYYKICRQAISLNAAKFNTQRVVSEYIKKAYK